MSKVQNLLKNKSWRRTRVTGLKFEWSGVGGMKKKKKRFVSESAVNRMPTLTYSAQFLGQFCSISFQITITFHSRVKCKCQHISRKHFHSRRRKKKFSNKQSRKKSSIVDRPYIVNVSWHPFQGKKLKFKHVTYRWLWRGNFLLWEIV